MTASVLSHPALVLNRSWTAIATTPVRNALGLIFTGSAKAIQPDTYETHDFESWAELAVPPDEPCVRTVKLEIKVPEVIVLTRYKGMPRQRLVFTRRNLFKRDNFTCQYCGERPGTSELTIDHILPRSRGGMSSWDNCVLACVACNHRKADRTPMEIGWALLKKPIEPTWAPTFEAPIGRVRVSWEKFISERYWNTTLEP